MGYTILEHENVPEVLKNKPRWMACAIIVMTTLAITTSAVAAGAFVGYTYCYLEHRHNMVKGNFTHPPTLKLMHVPFLPEKAMKNATINSALSSFLLNRLSGLRPGHILHDEDIPTVSWVGVPGNVPGVAHVHPII